MWRCSIIVEQREISCNYDDSRGERDIGEKRDRVWLILMEVKPEQEQPAVQCGAWRPAPPCLLCVDWVHGPWDKGQELKLLERMGGKALRADSEFMISVQMMLS